MGMALQSTKSIIRTRCMLESSGVARGMDMVPLLIHDGSLNSADTCTSGTLTVGGKVRYTGEWSHGKYDGLGHELYNSTVFEGQFKDGLRHGLGTFSCGGQQVYSSEFCQGQPVNVNGFSSPVTKESFNCEERAAEYL